MGNQKVFVAGHRGMVGRAVHRELAQKPGYQIITRDRVALDLRDQKAVKDFLSRERPDCVILAAATVGGIYANTTFPANFIYDNLAIACNVIHSAFEAGVRQILNLGSSCIYPKVTSQPIAEGALLSGALERTNEPYAVAKIAGIKLCESYNRQYGTDFRSLMPTNLYGPHDNFHPENSHVLPALIRKFYYAGETRTKTVTIWGTGKPRREFLHVYDMAAACSFVMDIPKEIYEMNADPMLSHINVGTGQDLSILELAELIADISGFEGEIITDEDKPDGTMNKRLDVNRLKQLGWEAKIPLREGITQVLDWYRNADRAR